MLISSFTRKMEFQYYGMEINNLIGRKNMSRRTRSIGWMEGKVVEILSKRCQIQTYLALSECVLENVRNLEEQHTLDIAVAHLISDRQITQKKDQDGFTVYKLVA